MKTALLIALAVAHLLALPVDPAPQEANQDAVAPCDAARLASCLALGDALSLRDDSEQRRQALKAYQTGCDGGLAQACQRLGAWCLSEDMAELCAQRPVVYFARAAALFGAACDRGGAGGCEALRDMCVARQIGCTTDRVRELAYRAETIWRNGCRSGVADDCDDLSRFCGRADRDTCRVISMIMACRKGRSVSCGTLGAWYREGQHGVQRDASRAADYLSAACLAGDQTSCPTAVDLCKDQHVARHEPRCVPILSRACNAADAMSCEGLAAILADSPLDPEEVRQLRKKAQSPGLN
jgi:uncharacterized protein